MNSLETQLSHELRELAAGQPFLPDVEAIGRRARLRHRRGLALRGVSVAGAAALAAAGLFAAVHTTGGTTGGTAAGTTASPAATKNSKLMTLAALITASSGRLPGNASLIIRTQAIGHRRPYVTYNLYADSGAMYVTDTERQLRSAIAHHDNLADGTEARQVAVARYAATGDLSTARLRMINITRNYLGLGLSPAAQQREWAKALAAARAIYKEKGVKTQPKPLNRKTVQELAGNYLWTNSVQALSEGGGSPQVRAGVLRLISTISGVTVANSTTDGQPTLTLTAGPEVFGGTGQQVLTIDAKTGMPISSVVSDLGPQVPTSVETYQVSRVTLADIEAGKF